jgi:carbonic anhydrase
MRGFPKALAVFALVLTVGLFAGVSYGGHAVHWGYEGEGGPEHWAELSPEYEACGQGAMQSPIDIRDARSADLPDISFLYEASPLRIIDNGHAIQVNYAEGSSITIDGKKYRLLQFHFHAPSENSVMGERYAMEAHLVHKSDDGQLAVVAVFMKKGGENAFIQTLWDNIPDGKGRENEVSGTSINAAELLPADRTYYRFTGSLTTPPCSEGVLWNVLKTPIELSEEQLAAFTARYSMNARPVQPLNGRVVEVGK